MKYQRYLRKSKIFFTNQPNSIKSYKDENILLKIFSFKNRFLFPIRKNDWDLGKFKKLLKKKKKISSFLGQNKTNFSYFSYQKNLGKNEENNRNLRNFFNQKLELLSKDLNLFFFVSSSLAEVDNFIFKKIVLGNFYYFKTDTFDKCSFFCKNNLNKKKKRKKILSGKHFRGVEMDKTPEMFFSRKF